jgi:Domain of unknown function (DUF4440)
MRFALLLAVCINVCSMARAQETDLQIVDRLSQQFGQAWLLGDTQTLDHLLAREYTHTDVTGKVLHKAEWLADAANLQKWLRAPGGTRTPSIDFQDVELNLVGAVVVVTGENVIRSANPKNPPIKLRFTQVWVKEGREWKRRFFQATSIEEAKP